MLVQEKTLPFFPLNISLLPGEDIPLRIFEPRYKELINDCLTEKMNFGIPFLKNSQIHDYGVECKIKQVVAKNSRGEMVIYVEGISNFKVLSNRDTFPGKLYGGGKVLTINNDVPIRSESFQKMWVNYTNKHAPELLKSLSGDNIMINDVAKALNLSSEDKIRYISLTDTARQENFLKAQLFFLTRLRQQEKLLNNNYMLN